MDFLQHTITWIKGEIFEAILFGSFGLLVIISSLSFIKFGNTPNSKSIIIPLMIVGIFFFGTAISGIISNKKKIATYSEAFKKDRIAFVKSEKLRVEGFQYLYKMTIIIAGLCFGLTIFVFIFSQNSTFKSIAIALTIFGTTGLIIDYFSKERADIYYKEIVQLDKF